MYTESSHKAIKGFGKGVCKAGKPLILHPDGQILPLEPGREYPVNMGITGS